MQRRWIAAACAMVWLGVAAGCADLFGFKELHLADAAIDDATPPNDASDANADVDTCTHARWPSPSDAGAPVDGSDYVVALSHIYFSSIPDGGTPTFGYDLDDRCTNANDPSTASCTSANVINDGVNGIDDESIQIMSSLSGFAFASSLTDPSINGNIAAGGFSIILTVNQYGGGLNQSHTTGLTIAVQGATGLESPALPQFDGHDRWIVDTEDTVSPATNTAKFIYPADVVNGVLVSTFNNETLTLHVLLPNGDVSGVLSVTLHEPVVTAQLVKRADGNFDAVSGIIGGRWKATDLLGSLADLTVNGAPFCEYFDGGAQASAQMSYVCPKLDITSAGPDNDTIPCDAIGVALAFDGVAAQVATNPAAFNVTPTPCPYDAGGCN